MMYIKKVQLKNFQSHSDTELDFVKGLNVILGHSDSGKTSILRGIRWCLYNKPSGWEFLREGETEVSVRIVFQNNLEIIRMRSASKNRYTIIYPDGEELILEGFGTGVPKEVIEATGMKEIELDERETSYINYAAQLEGPFLLNETDSVKASAIGRLVGVNYIDDAMREALRDKKQAEQLKKHWNEEKDKLENSLKKYDYLDAEEKKLTKLDALIEKIKILKKQQVQLSEFYKSYKSIKKEKESLKKILDNIGDLYELEILLNSLNIKYKDLREKYELFYQLDKLNIEKNRQQKILNNQNFISQLDPILQDLLYKTTVQDHLKQLLIKYQQCIKEENNLTIQIREYKNIEMLNLSNLNKKIKSYEYLKELNNRYNEIQQKKTIGKNFLKPFKSLDTEIDYSSLILQALRDLKRITLLNEEYQHTTQQLELATKKYSEAQKFYESSLNNFKVALSKVKVCPLCYQPIDFNDINHIEEHFKGEDTSEL